MQDTRTTKTNRPQEEGIRRNILETALEGQAKTRATQEELIRQGEQLKVTLADAEQIANKTARADQNVDRLIAETKLTPTRRVLRCCCPCFVSAEAEPKEDNLKLDPSAKLDFQSVQEDQDTGSVLQMDNLDKILSEGVRGSKRPSWMRTLGPLDQEASIAHSADGNWHRQVEASLNQLYQAGQHMGKSLEEQIRLAQMLAIYLDYGTDQVMGANEKLVEAQKKESFK